MIVSLIGNGSLSKLAKVLGKTEDEVKQELSKVAKKLAELNIEIYLVPEGVQSFIATEYKKFGGKKVIGSIPREDKIWGIDFLNLDIIDEEVDCTDWFKQPYSIVTNCDKILMLGMGQMTIGELGYIKYNYKFSHNSKNLFVYTPLLNQDKLLPEFTLDIEPLVHYVHSIEELGKILK